MNFNTHNLLILTLSCLLLNMCHPSGQLLSTHQRGPEDLTVFKQGTQRLLVTGTAERRRFSFSKASYLETLDLNSPSQEFQIASPPQNDRQFKPVGLDTIPDPRGSDRTLLFAINNRKNGPRVDVFEHHGTGFEPVFHTDTASRILTQPNGIAVANNGTIYVTNVELRRCPKNQPSSGAPADETNKQNNTIVACQPCELGGDGVWRVVAHGLDGANGLVFSKDSQHLLAASYHRKTIHAFPRNANDNSLDTPTLVTTCPFGVDNLKSVGPNHFTACGQKGNLLTLGLHFLFLTPTLPGAAIHFSWTPENGFQEIQDHIPLLNTELAKDCYAPSTLIIDGNEAYTGHIMTRGVRKYSLNQ